MAWLCAAKAPGTDEPVERLPRPGNVWGAFHWVALAGNADAPFAYMAVSTVLLVAISVIMTFVFNGSGESVPVVAVIHAMYDTASIGVAPLIETTMPLVAFALTAIVAWLVVLGLVAVKGTSLGGAHSARVRRPQRRDQTSRRCSCRFGLSSEAPR